MQNIASNRKVLHLLFCVAIVGLGYLGIYYYFGGFREENVWWHELANCVYFLFCIYVGRWLCIKWYLKNQPVNFVVYTLAACLLLTLFWYGFIKYVEYYINAGFLELFVNHMPIFFIGLVAGVFIKLTRVSIQKQIQDAHIATEQKQSELNLLQSQLSPHFLFNTLNNLYGISITQHERVPALLLKLSDLLRYTVYDTKKAFVPLNEELVYINNYIEFEKIRISDRLLLQTNMETVTNIRIKVAPMVLIVFIENAFKHAKNTLEQKICIDISLKISDNFIMFSVINSFGNVKESNSVLNENSGLGLANTIKRLDLLYGEDYTLKQTAESDMYTVLLTLKIK